MIIKQSKRHILFLKNKSGRSLRRKIRSKRKRKLRRILKASGIMYINKSIPNSSKNRRRKEIELKVPSNFDLFNNQEDVLFFIVKLLNYKTDYRIKTIQLDLVDIDKLDSTAISILLNIIPTSVDRTRLRVRKKLNWEGKQGLYESLVNI